MTKKKDSNMQDEQEHREPVVVDRRSSAADQAAADQVEEMPDDEAPQPEGEALEWATRAAELQDMLLRKEADIQNMRKRHLKDMETARRNAVEALLADLFPALDGLAQASSGYKDSPDGENPLLDGIRSTLRIIDNAFQRHGITRISESGVPFDSELHQPLNVVDSDDVREEVVGEVFVEGYRLGETVLKPAMVQVLKPRE